ncbi:uncharacterized protein LOC108044962 [Drosophila rhopaloa]|uniref:Uncharacterized protein LOC108044962 n=1 Tax=Drosophila rhopaloa TaxID=1041015 RepID=A0A6P4EN35_DRORH|nr:uncharacterized protein LOC108044962 [Drosophila rhopaloa]
MTTADRPLDVSRSSGSGNKTASTRDPTQPPLSPPSVDRRRPKGIWSLLTLALVMSQLLHFPCSGGGCGVSAAPTPDPATTSTSAPSFIVPLKHLQKRSHSGVTFWLRFQEELKASRSHLEWENTCGHNRTGLNPKRNRQAKRCKKRQMILQNLQIETARNLRHVQSEDKARTTTNPDQLATNNSKALDIMKRRKWTLHKVNYKFLPRLNNSSQQLNLRHVHRDLQFYVGAFSYLRHAKMHWDYANLQAESVLSEELLRMRTSARQVLCSVEGAINLTNLLYGRQPPSKARQQRQKKRQASPLVTYKIIPLKLMEKRLQQFKTPLVELHHQATLAASGAEVAPPPATNDLQVDALFVKMEFVQYLKSIRKILDGQRKQLCQKKSLQMVSGGKVKQIKS